MSVNLNNARKGLLAVAVGFACALPVAAQNTTPPTATATPYTTTTASEGAVRRDDDHRDWGWLGLFGLAGLIGLRRRDRGSHTIDRTRNASAL
jgi:MYXO-CTERM domain-containing protein